MWRLEEDFIFIFLFRGVGINFSWVIVFVVFVLLKFCRVFLEFCKLRDVWVLGDVRWREYKCGFSFLVGKRLI